MNDRKKGTSAVFGIFDQQSDLERSVNQLKATGFRQADISCLLPGMTSMSGESGMAHEKSTKTPEGVATGATTGFALGGILGWLVGAGSLAIPGIGPLVAAGPILGAIAGAGIGTAVGGVGGALVGYGIPEYEAKRYEEQIRDGAYLLSVHVDDSNWKQKAKGILVSCGARDVSVTGEEKQTRKTG